MDEGDVRKAVTYLEGLDDLFCEYADPYRAHAEARPLLADMAKDPAFFRAVLMQHLSEAGVFNHLRKNPVVEFIIACNERYTLIANCFFPRDDRDITLSHQSVHHHGALLLTTAAMFGPGYETWNFTKPEPIAGNDLLFNMSVTYTGQHTAGNLLFVDAFIPHIVFYPERLSITLALWSERTPVSWKAKVKKNPLLQRVKNPLKATLQCLGLAHPLGLNVVSLLDYYPARGAFKGLKKRVMYPMGTNENFLLNMFHILQQTGNADLLEVVDRTIQRDRAQIPNASLVVDYSARMKAGITIEPRFEEVHRFLPYANLKRADVRSALTNSGGGRSANPCELIFPGA